MSRFLSFFLLGLFIVIGLSFVLSILDVSPSVNYAVCVYTAASLLTWLPIVSWLEPGIRETGSLILKIGRSLSNYWFLSCGLIFAVASLALSIFFIYEHFGGSPNFVVTSDDWSPLILYWNISILYILIGCSNVLVYENGMYFMFNLLKWQEIDSYHWDAARPNILVLNHKRPSKFIFGSISKIDIPEKHKLFLDDVLSTKLGTSSANSRD
ncbi:MULTISPECIES: hypothetical protein [unclassified Leptolyngbya]|uniref:hypothetical protein n=1 Tax=unclassified Leptolyngbya TaxID=2650499 RepID=UPI0016862477|nr:MULTISPECIES: hypothetical protein [unclassified Leptolyngbya]MBD1910221.1 hypothetical protein [Leptolyngbya sp. FACHB-8]MBD2156403.1 hypothetical protein [Leptolyngbya sp. FACHB-16]